MRLRAAALARQLLEAEDPMLLQPALLAFDRELKQAGINPGTSADLTVASHFAAELVTAAAAEPSSTDTITQF